MTNGNHGSNGHMARNGVNGASFDSLIEHPGLISYLTTLGLANAQLTELSHLLRTGENGELIRAIRGMEAKAPDQDLEQWDAATGRQTIKLYMAEEQGDPPGGLSVLLRHSSCHQVDEGLRRYFPGLS